MHGRRVQEISGVVKDDRGVTHRYCTVNTSLRRLNLDGNTETVLHATSRPHARNSGKVGYRELLKNSEWQEKR
ncbi:hypothetical protein DPMN_086387 [Dreissena polymorpha]|uniref:Uncharacterized protein n=1 Tax=Dreissena polymorpha TaxID=45954 RepID=A0A9D4KR30_DREPO|nr:hypothetical protein DPMN_086387 [Dreissena polymorpha]